MSNRISVSDYFIAPVQWACLLLIRMAIIIIGLFVVPFALTKQQTSTSLSDGRPIQVLPRWAWVFSNDYDGTLGDKRGWWAAHADTSILFGLLPIIRRFIKFPVVTADMFIAQYWWLAIRNPANNMRLMPIFCCPVYQCSLSYKGQFTVEDDIGRGGTRFTKALDKQTKAPYYGFYLVYEYGKTPLALLKFLRDRALVIQLGHKIKPEHATDPSVALEKKTKGFTIEVNPFKDLT